MRIKLLVAYDGTDYCGWQRQAHMERKSVQEVLEDALSRFYDQRISLSASGRTDAGVHAFAQIAHFDVDATEEKIRSRDLCWALAGMLPWSICVRKAWLAPQEFHSTLSATHKTYKYLIYNHPRSNPILRRTSYWKRQPLDIDHLRECSKYLIGHHDFASFKTAGTDVTSTDRTILEAGWKQKTKNMLEFTVTGEGFLKQMVRTIVGTQMWLQKNGRPPSDMKAIIEAADRRKAGPSAKPEGLFLWRVYYPPELERQCVPLSFP